MKPVGYYSTDSKAEELATKYGPTLQALSQAKCRQLLEYYSQQKGEESLVLALANRLVEYPVALEAEG